MAEAKGHKFGQTLGDYCEHAIEPILQEFANKHGLYLDRQGNRPARRGKRVRWIDSYGNCHDLDYVLERGGTPNKLGTPVAFIESAWRRYTKHSRNKAQEIQGAVLPLRDRHRYSAPFMGCFLAGDYTSGARDQLASLGFHLIYFDYPTIIEAFKLVGIDARYDESTPDEEFAEKQLKWDKLSQSARDKVWKKLLDLNAANIRHFMEALERAVNRQISIVRVIPLHGTPVDCPNVNDAIQFVAGYSEDEACEPLLKYEVQIRYNNGDKVDAQFNEKAGVIDFLEHYQTGNWTPVADEEASDIVAENGEEETQT
jgi:hypothetical protein